MRLVRHISFAAVCIALLIVGTGGAAGAVENVKPTCKTSYRASACPSARPSAALAQSSKRRQGRVVRTGRIVDTDTTYGDGVFQIATGKAFCKRNEQVVSGGLRIVNVSGLFGGPARTMPGESAPILKRPAGWSVAFGSDLGGQARRIFRVVVVCAR